MDEKTRDLERRAQDGDLDAVEELAAHHIRVGDPERVYFLIFETMKRETNRMSLDELRESAKSGSANPRLERLWAEAEKALAAKLDAQYGIDTTGVMRWMKSAARRHPT